MCTSFNVNTKNPGNSNHNFGVQIVNVDADWDYESGQLELRSKIEKTYVSGINNTARVNSVGFQVSILAAVMAQTANK